MDLTSVLGGGVFGAALLALIGKILGWKINPKEKIDVDKVKSDIRVDESEIESSRVTDAEKNSKMALEITALVRTQLDKANLIIDKLSMEKDTMRELVLEIKRESFKRDSEQHNRIAELEKRLNTCEQHLAEEKKHCQEAIAQLELITIELNKYKEKYGKI